MSSASSSKPVLFLLTYIRRSFLGLFAILRHNVTSLLFLYVLIVGLHFLYPFYILIELVFFTPYCLPKSFNVIYSQSLIYCYFIFSNLSIETLCIIFKKQVLLVKVSPFLISSHSLVFNPIHNALFWGLPTDEKPKRAPLSKSVTHILQ